MFTTTAGMCDDREAMVRKQELGPEQFIAELQAWMPRWAETLDHLQCAACSATLTDDHISVTSARAWNVGHQSFEWHHRVQVACISCRHIASFDGDALAKAHHDETRASDRARATVPAPD